MTKLRAYRRERKISVICLAEETGFSQQYIAKIELGIIEPPREHVELLYEAIVGRKDYKGFSVN